MLKSLLAAHLHHVLIFVLSKLQPCDSNSLISALTQALKAFSTALVEVVGPPQWGLNVDQGEIKPDAVTSNTLFFPILMLCTIGIFTQCLASFPSIKFCPN